MAAALVFVGVTVRPQAQPSAVVVTQLDYIYSRITRKRLDMFTLRGLEMISAHTPYQAIAERLKQIVDNVHTQAAQYKARVILYVDVTGLGDPIIDLIKAKVDPLITVYVTNSDKRSENKDKVTVGKSWLIAKMQTILQDGRLKAPKTPVTEVILNDLLLYDLDPAPTDNELTGSFTVGTQDQLLTALALACQGIPDKEEAGEEFMDWMNRRALRPLPTKASRDWLKEWSGPKAIRSINPLTGDPMPDAEQITQPLATQPPIG
jgi:hypothetical protein